MKKELDLIVKLMNLLDEDSEAYKIAFDLMDMLAYGGKPNHECPYCGDISEHVLRIDELCDDCKMLFGHSFISEL